MSESMRMWVEVTFNVAYLITVWALVIAMFVRRQEVSAANTPLARLFITAFGLLALGDTAHVGLRVLAYLNGGLETATAILFGNEVGLVGLGALATAITVTFFYVAVVYMWKTRFNKPLGWAGIALLVVAVIRLLIMIPAANEWNNVVPPQPWSLYRNLPLMIQGFGVAALILWDARREQDRVFMWIGVMILASYTFYTPVVLFVQQVPLLGMLMIPKTLAYVAIAVIGYRSLYPHRSPEERKQPSAA